MPYATLGPNGGAGCGVRARLSRVAAWCYAGAARLSTVKAIGLAALPAARLPVRLAFAALPDPTDCIHEIHSLSASLPHAHAQAHRLSR